MSGKTFWNSRVAATSGLDSTTMRSRALSFEMRSARASAAGAKSA